MQFEILSTFFLDTDFVDYITVSIHRVIDLNSHRNCDPFQFFYIYEIINEVVVVIEPKLILRTNIFFSIFNKVFVHIYAR